MEREYSIQDLAKAAGTTSRTLRHYDSVGLLKPTRIGANGYRHYDDRSVLRLQRILLLRDLGLGLEAIARVLDAQSADRHDGEAGARSEARILRTHLELLHGERARIAAQIGAVERTIAALLDGADDPDHDTAAADAPTGPRRISQRGDLMSQNIFEGFDHTRYRGEVEERWGERAYADGDRWWRGLGADGRREWKDRLEALNADWIAAVEGGEDPAGETGRDLARRHVEWLQGVPGPASSPDGDLRGYVLALGEMYVADERFAANYGGRAGAEFVRAALRAYLTD